MCQSTYNMLLREDFLDNIDDKDIISTPTGDIEQDVQKRQLEEFQFVFEFSLYHQQFFNENLLKYVFLLKKMLETCKYVTDFSDFLYKIEDGHVSMFKKKDIIFERPEDVIAQGYNQSGFSIGLCLQFGLDTKFTSVTQIISFIRTLDRIFNNRGSLNILAVGMNNHKIIGSRLFYIRDIQQFYDFFQTGHVDNTCTGQMPSQATLLDIFSNLIIVMIPKQRQLKEFDKLVDIMNVDLPTRMLRRAKIELGLKDKKKINIPKTLKKKISESVINVGELYASKDVSLIYTRNGVVKDSQSVSSSNGEFLEMSRQITSLQPKQFQFMYDKFEERIVFLVYAGSFIYNSLEYASASHLATGVLCFKYLNKSNEDNTLMTGAMLRKYGFDITDNELIKIMDDYKKTELEKVDEIDNELIKIMDDYKKK